MLFDDDKKKPTRAPLERDNRNRDWREMDRKKDRSAHRESGSGGQSGGGGISGHGLRGDHAERYKKQLEELFKGGRKPSAEQEQSLKKIRQARGAEIDKLCQKY